MIAINNMCPKDGGLGAALETKLVKDALDVRLCGVGGDAKGAGYLLVALPLGNQFYDLKLARRQTVKGGPFRSAHGDLEPTGPAIAVLL